MVRTEVLSLALLLPLVALPGCGGAPTVAAPATPARPSPAARGNAAVPSPRPSHQPPLAPGAPRAPLAAPSPFASPTTVWRVPAEGWPRELPQGPEPIFRETGPLGGPIRLRPDNPRYDRKSDYWSPCVRDFVQTQPEAARLALGEALSLYSTSCAGGPARRIEFRTPPAARATQQQSYLGLVGALEPATCELALTAAYHGEPLHAERITLIAEGVRWSSPRILFDRADGWEVATLPLSRSLVRVVQDALAARDTVLRFEGLRGYQDVAVTEEMKQDLRVVLDALDAINRP